MRIQTKCVCVREVRDLRSVQTERKRKYSLMFAAHSLIFSDYSLIFLLSLFLGVNRPLHLLSIQLQTEPLR